jgi:SagB-type dehydrogenase family enzyme
MKQKELAKETIKLPKPDFTGRKSLEETIKERRSVRKLSSAFLTIDEISQLLWAGQGISSKGGYRTAPSAGALYPLELFLVSGDIHDLSQGIFKYNPNRLELIKQVDGDVRKNLAHAALDQEFIEKAPATIIVSAIYKRTTSKYGERGIKYAHIEVGHAAQNISLQAVALNLGTVMVGAFYDNKVKEILKPEEDEQPNYLIPIGKI